MTIEVGMNQTMWNLIPSSTAEEIAQCVRCILLTAKGSCFMYRSFGVDNELLDKPLNVAQQKFLAEAVRQVQRYEPRAKVKSIRWQGDGADGILKPIILIEIRS